MKFGSKSSVLDTISAKNTTGFDSITNVTYTVKYKAKGSNKFKKAKKVNTSKVGAYQVKFSLVDEIGRKASLRVNYNVLNKIPLTAFTLNRTAKTLYLGGTTGETTTKIKLKTAKPAKASIQTLKFSSLNTGVATIDAKGKVTAVGVGTATIKAKSMDGSNLKAYCKIRVNKYATGMTASVSASAFDVAQTMQIVTALQPSDATGTNSIGYTFTSSNPAVASVDGQGLITGVSAGTATITVQATGAAKNNKSVSTQIDITINATNVIPGDVSSSALGIN